MGFLESTCKESHAHARFEYFSVFIWPITVAHDGLVLAICIGPVHSGILPGQ